MAKKNKKPILTALPDNEKEQIWKARKAYAKGMGYSLQDERYDTNAFFLRLEVKNQKAFEVRIGESWVVTMDGFYEGMPVEGKRVIYFVGSLKEKFVEKKTKVKHVEEHQAEGPEETEVLPFLDQKNPDRVIYMSVTTINHRVERERFHSEIPLKLFRERREEFLTDFITEVLLKSESDRVRRNRKDKEERLSEFEAKKELVQKKYWRKLASAVADVLPPPLV